MGSEDLEGGCKQKDNPTTPIHMRQAVTIIESLDNTAEKVL